LADLIKKLASWFFPQNEREVNKVAGTSSDTQLEFITETVNDLIVRKKEKSLSVQRFKLVGIRIC
jgi:hypothetical protein